MIVEKDIEDIRRWMGHPWKKFAKGLGVNTATLWRWRRYGVPDGPGKKLLEFLKNEMLDDPDNPSKGPS